MKKAYIGIDSHKEQNTLATALAGRGDPELYGKAPADLDAFVRALRRALDKYGLAREDVALCYEAGPTGFVLARRLRSLGFECEVAAPSRIPVKASDRDAVALYCSSLRASGPCLTEAPDADSHVRWCGPRGGLSQPQSVTGTRFAAYS